MNSISKGIKRKKIFHLITFSIVLFIILLNMFGLVRIGIENDPLTHTLLIITCLIPISGAIWALSLKSVDTSLEKFKSMCIKELEMELTNLRESEIDSYDIGTRIIANSFFMLFTFIFMFFSIIMKDYNQYTSIFKYINNINKETLTVAILCLFLVVYQIGALIGNPITPRKYKKKQIMFLNQVKYTFYDNITNSSLNPYLCKK